MFCRRRRLGRDGGGRWRLLLLFARRDTIGFNQRHWMTNELFLFILGDTQIATQCKHLFPHDAPRQGLLSITPADRPSHITRFLKDVTSRKPPLHDVIPDPFRHTSNCLRNPEQALLLATAAKVTRQYPIARFAATHAHMSTSNFTAYIGLTTLVLHPR